MQCPRCDGSLSTFSLAATGKTAVVCEACGFTGIAATYEPEQSDIESWDRAMRRFERTDQFGDETCETGRTETVSVPADETPDVDPEAFEERLAVGATPEQSPDDETPEIDPESLETSVAVTAALEWSPGEDTEDETE